MSEKLIVSPAGVVFTGVYFSTSTRNVPGSSVNGRLAVAVFVPSVACSVEPFTTFVTVDGNGMLPLPSRYAARSRTVIGTVALHEAAGEVTEKRELSVLE